MLERDIRSLVYILAIASSVIMISALAASWWPLVIETRSLLLIPVLLVLFTLAGRFPIELSRQASASLSTVPLFMAVLLLHPLEAALLAASGTLASELWLKAPPRAIGFNVTVNAAAAVLAGVVLFTLKPQAEALQFTGSHMLAAGASGLALHATNLLLVIGLVTLRKGLSFWKSWTQTYTFEAVQEGGLLTLGLIAAVLYTEAAWSLILVLVPCVLAYYGFRRSVSEAAGKARLAEELEQRLDELQELQAQLIQSAKLASVGTLAAGVAHEINNPVFAITGRAELLLKDPDLHLVGERAREYTKTIYEMGQRISQIVRQLLDYSRTSQEAEEVLLSDAMDAALGLLGDKTESKRALITKEYGDVPPVIGVPSQIQQVFVNLLSNAIDATSEGGSIVMGCRADGGTVEGYVRDTGPGIPSEFHSTVFEPFYTTKEVGKGTGLGLFVCHKIVAAHDGVISIDSHNGSGVIIRVRLPSATATAEVEVSQPAEVAAETQITTRDIQR